MSEEKDNSTTPVTDNEKIYQSISGIKKFTESLGNSDVHTNILIEEILKIFMQKD